MHKKGETAYLRTWSRARVLAKGIRLTKTSCQNASEGMYSGSQCQASSMLQSAKKQGKTALSVMQPKLHGGHQPSSVSTSIWVCTATRCRRAPASHTSMHSHKKCSETEVRGSLRMDLTAQASHDVALAARDRHPEAFKPGASDLCA